MSIQPSSIPLLLQGSSISMHWLIGTHFLSVSLSIHLLQTSLFVPKVIWQTSILCFTAVTASVLSFLFNPDTSTSIDVLFCCCCQQCRPTRQSCLHFPHCSPTSSPCCFLSRSYCPFPFTCRMCFQPSFQNFVLVLF